MERGGCVLSKGHPNLALAIPPILFQSGQDGMVVSSPPPPPFPGWSALIADLPSLDPNPPPPPAHHLVGPQDCPTLGTSAPLCAHLPQGNIVLQVAISPPLP
eukprot:Sspe_Gene.26487::Locus_11013_Transcript_1_1_Confidence_1.000_Length_501::g.26487::m.26487